VSAPLQGVCRYCGCTEESPCRYCRGIYGCTMLHGVDASVCGAPACLRAEKRQAALAKDAAKAARRKHGDRYLGMGYGAVIEDLRRRKRALRRKR